MKGATIALLLTYGALWTPGTGFLMQKFSRCLYSDDKQGNITFITGFTFNYQCMLAYSMKDDMYLPCGYYTREMWNVVGHFAILLNTDPNTVTRVKREEERCKEEVRTFWNKTVERRGKGDYRTRSDEKYTDSGNPVKPSVEVFLPVPLHSEGVPVLVCQVWGFYPQKINVAWFKNDKLVKNYTEASKVGDWTYRIVATLDMRDTRPEDNYTCMVDHSSLGGIPIAKNWKHGLTNIQIIKISVATVVFVLGLTCFITGLVCSGNAKRRGYSPIQGYYEDN